MGARGATTLLFKNNKFLIPSTNNYYDSLEKENVRIAELAAKNAALLTIVDHEARI